MDDLDFVNLNYHGYTFEIHNGGSFKEEGEELLYSGGSMGKGLKEGLFEVYKDSSIIQLIGQLLEHKYCQLYVKHITDPKANVENPKAATEGGAEETCHGTTSGSLGRKGVDAVVDPAAEESEENNSGNESDFAYGDVLQI
ncbi:hypothetical protein CDL15_Pgr016835 [Punica granatum]|uniref:Uncharacterized protein n=1 Tax=Punica granatum TaxID=22663 RepID=A0A218WXZ6_PUNGR|nr:hypothetical protein CDL15_Pgr016835 [Punica granatum]